MSSKVAIIQFPGSNCERETQSALKSVGIENDIIRWNCDDTTFHSYGAYILPGGFSYQDRIRVGVVASKLPIMSLLRFANEKKKPILGICNGCQILAESGLIPDTNNGEKETAITHNTYQNEPIGHVCDWIYVSINNAESNIFTKQFNNDTPLAIPVNHGMGQFIFKPQFEIPKDQTLIKYCNADGSKSSGFPTTPNGSTLEIAGIGNKAGNVLGLMPHPDRAFLNKQLPSWIHNDHSKEDGPWAPLFRSLKESL